MEDRTGAVGLLDGMSRGEHGTDTDSNEKPKHTLLWISYKQQRVGFTFFNF